MKKFLLLSVLATTLTLNAQDAPKAPQERPPGRPPGPPHKELTVEQKKTQADLLAKYDTNKDGHIDRDERGKMTPEDRKKDRESGLGGRGTGGPHRNGPPPPPPHETNSPPVKPKDGK